MNRATTRAKGKESKAIKITNDIAVLGIEGSDEKLEFNFSDQGFYIRLLDLVDGYKSVASKFEGQFAELELIQDEQEKIVKRLRLNYKIHTDLKNSIDETFGVGTCLKVFGDITPSLEQMAEFFNSIVPVLAKYSKEKAKANAIKYSASRVGSV